MLDLPLNKWACSQWVSALIIRSRNISNLFSRMWDEYSGSRCSYLFMFRSDAEPQLTLEPHYSSFLFDCSSLKTPGSGRPCWRLSPLSSASELFWLMFCSTFTQSSKFISSVNKRWGQIWDQKHGWSMMPTRMRQPYWLRSSGAFLM